MIRAFFLACFYTAAPPLTLAGRGLKWSGPLLAIYWNHTKVIFKQRGHFLVLHTCPTTDVGRTWAKEKWTPPRNVLKSYKSYFQAQRTFLAFTHLPHHWRWQDLGKSEVDPSSQCTEIIQKLFSSTEDISCFYTPAPPLTWAHLAKLVPANQLCFNIVQRERKKIGIDSPVLWSFLRWKGTKQGRKVSFKKINNQYYIIWRVALLGRLIETQSPVSHPSPPKRLVDFSGHPVGMMYGRFSQNSTLKNRVECHHLLPKARVIIMFS